jgi:AcrR family transcriptional regulator
MATSAQARILDTATELFRSQGIRAIGVDTIIAKSCVAKTTLYHHFKSKDELVVAFLERIDASFWQWWDKAVEQYSGKPREQIVGIFRALAKKVSSPQYRGCPFINTLTEFPDPEHASRLIIARNKREVHRRFKALAEKISANNSDMLATQLVFLMDGVYSLSMMVGSKHQSEAVVQAAEALIAAQVRRHK